ncbi:precorrin-3B synthase [Williamsia sp. CHRR-6]|uniref:precorrin-3B synthase n=1 Tax=Williamsia sp. CHRR-6 TaxID=2835871 RepID=UPI001BDA8005|nr:precorrin-3B synthase [Williamsia sp. CHRR-6]MBT0568132.1 precorrin-3B synthase [Williamsia sp. CHRR-6]
MDRPTDRCPGVFTTHPGADGHVARIRLLGGRLDPAELAALAEFALAHGDGHLEITGRANLQVRGLSADVDPHGLVEAGLVPSPAHDRVRNLMVSPRSGRVSGHPDLWPVAVAVEAGLLADPQLARLPGRFLFGFDDGGGDITVHGPDLGVIARDDELVEVVVAGRGTSLVIPARHAPAVILDAASWFTDHRTDHWRIADLDATRRHALTQRIAATAGPNVVSTGGDGREQRRGDLSPLVGWFDQSDGRVMLGSTLPHGRVPARTAQFFAAVDAPVIVTGDREVVLCDLEEGVAETVVRVLAPMGVIFDAASPWVQVSSCVGAPGCASSAADVRSDLEARVVDGEPPTTREHWVGCARGCGSPGTHHLRVLAGSDGYERQAVERPRLS